MKSAYRSFLVVTLIAIAACSSPEQQAPIAQPIATPGPTTAATPPAEAITREPVAVVKSLDDFQSTVFCSRYSCRLSDSWDLRVGGRANTYSTSLENVGVELSTLNNEVVGAGLMFFERDRLTAADFEVVRNFLASMNTRANAAAATEFVRSNIERSVFQIRRARSTSFADYTMWAGKVGNDQTLSLEKRRK